LTPILIALAYRSLCHGGTNAKELKITPILDKNWNTRETGYNIKQNASQ
jgi:hypothetical protein